MSKYVVISFLAACVCLPSAPAAAFTTLDKSVRRADAAAPLHQVRKQCKGKQSGCYALKHNF